jgi:hypothetical protein
MKSIKNFALAGFLALGAFLTLTNTSCKKDSTSATSKFVGTWNVKDSCGGSYTNDVTAGTVANTVVFSNLGNYSNPAKVTATVGDSVLAIVNFVDATGRKFNGSGSYSNNKFVVVYTVKYTDSTSETCTAGFSK